MELYIIMPRIRFQEFGRLNPLQSILFAPAPGFFGSDQTIWAFDDNQERVEKLLARVPMGRLGKLEELEGTIAYLASSAADYRNRQALILDGGFLSW